MLNIRLRNRRKELKLSQEYVAKKLGITRQGYGHYETGRNEPDARTLIELSKILNCSIDYLYGKTNNPELTVKDEKDIAKKLENIIKELDSETGLSFSGEPMDDETRELIKMQIEHNLRLAKQLAKKKFTPKKYRKSDNK
jgi:transcriptional regulator with XRE-family HTH domain